MWALLIKKYWQVSLFKETPANTPYSPALLLTISLFYWLLIVMQWFITDVKQELTLGVALVAAAALVISYTGYTYALLTVCKQRYRVIQTLTCLLAAHTIVHICALPLLLVVPLFATQPMPQPMGSLLGVLYLILTLILTVWQFMLSAYVYKKALEIDYLPAVLASLGLLAANILTVSFWR